MRVAVIGASGQLGADIVLAFRDAGNDVMGLGHADIEISDAESVKSVLGAIAPQVVINTAAMHHVEQCEADPAKSFAINGIGTRNLAQVCEAGGTYFLHISTDYVFDGAKGQPYVETDAPRPLNVYGNTKLSGEHFALAACSRSAVLRVSGVYGTHPCRAKGGMNFVRLMLKLAAERPELRVVDDEILTPTFTVDIAQQVLRLAESGATGLFHGTAQGACSWYEFASAIFEISGTTANLQKARPGEFPAKVSRPSYSVLDNAALRKAALDVMPDWRDGLTRYLKAIG